MSNIRATLQARDFTAGRPGQADIPVRAAASTVSFRPHCGGPAARGGGLQRTRVFREMRGLTGLDSLVIRGPLETTERAASAQTKKDHEDPRHPTPPRPPRSPRAAAARPPRCGLARHRSDPTAAHAARARQLARRLILGKPSVKRPPGEMPGGLFHFCVGPSVDGHLAGRVLAPGLGSYPRRRWFDSNSRYWFRLPQGSRRIVVNALG